MHNNRAYRMVLNAMTWGSFAWSQLLLASNYEPARRNNHFLNYVNDCAMTIRGVARSEEQKTRTYIFDRASTFFNEFYNDNDYIGMVNINKANTHTFHSSFHSFIDYSLSIHPFIHSYFISSISMQNINPIHFINEVMFELWKVVTNDENPSGRPSVFISHYGTNQEAINYENEFEKILDCVKGTYNERKAVLLEELTKASEKLKKIFKMREECTRILLNPFVQMKTFRDTIETLTENSAARFIREFLGDSSKFEIMKKLHVIVAFYLELHRIFDFRVTEEEVNCVTIGDVIKGTGKYRSALLQKLWPEFKEVWRLVIESVRPRECVNAGEYEGQLALIDDENSPMMRVLLTFYQEDGEIYRAVSEGISKFQDDILGQVEGLKAPALGYDGDSLEGEDLALESLTANDARRLITGENYDGEVELLIFTHMGIDSGLGRESVRYDYVGIARDILCRYVSGRPRLRSGKEMSFRRECNFSSVELEPLSWDESEAEAIERKRNALIDSFRPLHGVESLRAYMDKAAGKKLRGFEGSTCGAECRRDIERITSSTKASNEEIEMECVGIAEVLAAVLRYVIGVSGDQNKMEAASGKTIGALYKDHISGEEIPEELSFMREWPGKCLLEASRCVLDAMSSKKYLFRDVKPNHSRSIEARLEREFASYRSGVLWGAGDAADVVARKKAVAEGKVRVLENLFQALNSSRHLLREPATPLKRAFRGVTKGIFQSEEEEEEKMLGNTPSRCFVGFMVWLQGLISDLHWEMSKDAGKTREYEAGSESRKEREERERAVYKEFIPPKPTILRDFCHRFEVAYNEKLADYIPKFGYSAEEVVIVDAKTKEEVTEEERERNYSDHKVLIVKKK